MKNTKRTTFIEADLEFDLPKVLVEFLKRRQKISAWFYDDMIGIESETMMHVIEADPNHKLVQQRQRHFTPEKNEAINEEVQKLLNVRVAREVKCPRWLENAVIMKKKKNGNNKVCLDLTDLNKACPKDLYPLPHIDNIVNEISGDKLLSSMGHSLVSTSYKMHPDDQEKMAFMTNNT